MWDLGLGRLVYYKCCLLVLNEIQAFIFFQTFYYSFYAISSNPWGINSRLRLSFYNVLSENKNVAMGPILAKQLTWSSIMSFLSILAKQLERILIKKCWLQRIRKMARCWCSFFCRLCDFWMWANINHSLVPSPIHLLWTLYFERVIGVKCGRHIYKREKLSFELGKEEIRALCLCS